MTASDRLDFEVAARLAGNRERIVELFEDSAFHSELAAMPDSGGWRHFSDQTYDGWYFVAGPLGFDVYWKDRGAVQYINRFVEVSAAAAYFFSESGFTTCRKSLPEGQRLHSCAGVSLPTPQNVGSAIDTIEALLLVFLGLVCSFATIFALLSSPQLANLLAAGFSALISLFCFYASHRAWQHRSVFRAT